MKKLAFLLIGLITLSSTTLAMSNESAESTATRYNAVYDGSKYIFVENGIEFSVFPDGEFDFYIPNYVQGVSVGVNAGPVGISFNTGYDYDPYVQYDQYGAVIQIEDTPLFYDNYGRLVQAGDVRINYRRNRIVNVGGLFIHYNNFGVFSHYTGFVNVYNRNYVFHPYHNFFYRPVFNRCLVWTTPYRRFYTPVRYNYAYHRNNYYRGYVNGYRNARRDFRRPETGRVAHNNGRRDNVDRNNARFRSVERTDNRGRRAIASNERTRTNNRGNNVSRDGRKDPKTNRGYISNKRNDRGIAQKRDRKERSYNKPSRGTVAKGRPLTSRTNPNSKGRPSRPVASKKSTSRKAVASKPSRGYDHKAQSRPSSKRRITTATRITKRSTPSRATQRSSSTRTNKATRSGGNRGSKSANRTSSSRR